MKRILFLLLFVCSFASGQIQKLEVIGLDTLTTTERNTITVPGDRVYFIYNETTGQFEYNVKGSGWTTFSGGGSGDVTAASAFGTDNALIRSDGTGKGVQASGITIDDSNNVTEIGKITQDAAAANDNIIAMNVVGSANFYGTQGAGVGSFYFQNDGDFTLSNGGAAGSGNIRFNWNSNTAARTYTFPDVSGTIAISTGGTALENIVEDTTPQLGGALDVQTNQIQSNTDVVIQVDADNNGGQGFLVRDGAGANMFSVQETAGVTVTGRNFLVDTDGSYNIGSPSIRWNNVYANKLHADDDIRFTATDVEPGTPAEGTLYADDSENRPKYYDGTSWKALLLDGDVSAGSGDVVGPASATDNAIARFDTATGKLLQNSGVTIDDSGNISTSGTVDGKDVSALPDISGTPVNNQLAVWTDADTVEGEADLSYDGNKLTISHNSVGNFNIMGEYLVPNLSAGQNVMLEFGRAVSTKNAAEFLFNYTADGSDLNYFTLGLNGRGAITMYGDRSVDFQGPIDVTGNITVSGTVDGVDISALTGTDVALADAGAYFTTDNVEAATQELAADVAGKVDGTISGRTSVTTVTAIGTQTVANYLSDGVPSAGEWVGLSDATPEYLTTSATFNFALLDEYNYDDSATDAATITFSNMGEGHKVRIKYNRASAPTYSGETPTQLPNTFSAGSWPANDDVEAVYYKRFGTVYYFFKEL